VKPEMKPPFWTTPKKIALTVVLAILFWFLSGLFIPKEVSYARPDLLNGSGHTDLAYIKKSFAQYDETHFQGRLKERVVSIDLNEIYPDFMGSTHCDEEGKNCEMHFNLELVLAPRSADLVLLHEMCHVKTWNHDIYPEGGMIEHGPSWRACMLQVDQAGEFRRILIDGYNGN